mmetsp:Transcript_5396/g.7415  ORF Transcript_5396/g.7415 Transcript_5396/m.7415 type:complete len:284 (-) Transcript_5396:139-990(-)|eukprot:CAMPEP_0185729668 /NCGR_PEP_ID=MMETSP1171-20130828/6894_1 /TAXON_ID=374046 /ORGANISM="Helicotheca tamensis, Strain CCMP826" /LENGTH=283 /DNA_ID=CAMNT_0028398561 /DNA_START=52 /DNA_END=903 /DNA_ORIENTATION=-
MTSIGGRVVVAASNAARKLGLALDNMGAQMEVTKYTERLVPSTRFVAVDGVAPTVSETAAFVAPSASVIGDVSVGPKSSIWYGATVRGDVNKVTIGENSSIGDRAVIHVAKIQGDSPTLIGNNVTVGPGAIVHAATLNDSCVVGASAQVLDGSVVETGAYVAPGAVVTPGTTVPQGQYWAGSPAKMMRKLTDEELEAIVASAGQTADLASRHAGECAKDFKQLAADEEQYLDDLERDPEYFQPTDKDEDDVLGQGVPGRIFNTALTHPEEGLKLKQKREQEGK